MLEHETDTILHAVREQTLGRRESIAMKEILAANIPYPIKMFFRTDVESSLLGEMQGFRERSRFSFEHPEVQSLQQQMNSILILHYTLSAEEFDKRLGDVVHLVANYLIRPQWTMVGVLFEKEETISSKALLRILKYFGAYEYLRDICGRYIRDKGLSSFSRNEFSHFLWKADGAYVSRKTGDELARTLTPLYEFFDYPNKSNANRIPAQALIKFFEDKGLSTVAARLEGEDQHALSFFTQAELSALLEDIRRSNGAFIVDPPEQAEPTAAAETAELPATPLPAPEGRSNGGPATQPAVTAATTTTTQENATGLPQVKPFPLAQFTETIDEGERKRFLKKIFRQDEHSFNTALQFMAGISTWRDASRFIDEVFIQNDVDPYSSDAKKFIDLIFQQFYPSR